MKKLGVLLLGLGIFTGINLNAQTQDPDQNPNYQNSAQMYAQQRDVLLNNQGETVQATYQAYDWSEHKAARKQARIDNRQAVRLAHARYYTYYAGRPFYNRSFYNNGFAPYYRPAPLCNSVLIGAGAHHLLYH